jgi:ATP-binding cassette subfamily F protein 3
MISTDIIQDNIKQILQAKITKSELPEFFFPHLAGMILEEPPTSGEDLYFLIGEFLLNGQKTTPEQAQSLCNDICKSLHDKKLISTDNKFSLVAEKLLRPVTLSDVKLREEKDTHSGFTDAFLGTEKIDFDELKFDPKKKGEKKTKKEMEAFQKHQEEMDKLRKMLPPVAVDHNKDKSKPKDLHLDRFTLIIGGKTLLEESSMVLSYGHKYGLVGRNGIGKTTLLSAIARKDFDKFPRHLQILLVEQEVTGSDMTVLQSVLETDAERDDLLKKEQEYMKDEEKYAGELIEIYKRLDEIDAHSAESRASVILSGLGFAHEDMKRPTKLFSGGWRMRVALARALFAHPDILLLDEPTNHLDLDAVMWLEDYLINWPNTVIIVSHAREFLNTVCTDIYHFFDQKLMHYKGNYDGFEKKRSESLIQSRREADAQQMRIDHVQKFIDKFRYNAKRASMVQSRIKSLQKMELVEEILDDPTCIFIFPTPDKLRPPLLKIEDGGFGYPGCPKIVKDVQFGVDMESRIAIVGANGVGKTTLLKLLLGDLALTEGQGSRNNRLRTSMFTQHHVDQLELTLSPVEQFMTSFPGSNQEAVRGHLGSFGISGPMALRPMYLLSGGQKSRVAFAHSCWKNPHIMIMDEPTNHLDIDAVNALIIALNNYQGGVLIVSHDQHLIGSVCDQIWYIKDQRLKKFHGDFEDYRKFIAAGH